AVLALYPLAVRLGGNRWAGVAAVLIAGLFVSMPMFYINWGRYTQLTGQVILPASVYLCWALLDKKKIDWRFTSLNVLVLASLALTHYRVFIFWVLFLAAFWLLKVRRRNLHASFFQTLILGLGTTILFLPWLVNLVQGKWITVLTSRVSTPAQSVSTYLQQYNAIGDLSKYMLPWVWVLLLICIAWGLWKRSSGTALISLWWFLLLLTANPAWIYLPGTGVISNFAIFIAVYIPAGILIGAAVAWSLNNIKGRINSEASSKTLWLYRGTITISVLLFIFVTIWVSSARLNDFQPLEHALVTSPDVHANNWINDFTSPEDRFLVNSFFAFNDSTIVGSDAGWWLPLLAHRQNTQPPINYATEQGSIPGYREWVNELVASIQRWGISDQNTLQLLQKRDITHIYIGQQQGRVNTPSPLLDPQDLLESPFYTPIYHQDRIWIFSVLQ
ncbi:hypothetical protein KA005_51680, partial [bacterium]|nr:hypothetical protein [bacterium]